jgi:hypothetical protein
MAYWITNTNRKMSRPIIEKISSQFPIGARVMYRNRGRKGDGNIATITDFLVGISNLDMVAAVQLSFDSGGNHYVSPNQLKTYYSLIDHHAAKNH